MGRRNDIETPDFLAESKGEKGDRLGGTSKDEMMHQARLDDIIEERNTRRKRQVNIYIVFDFFSVVLLVTGMCTVYWYSYTDTINSLSSEGNTISRTQEWGITINGLWLRLTYCRVDLGTCTIEREQFRYFATDANVPEMAWGTAYLEAAAKADEGATYFYAAVGLFFCANIYASSMMSLTFCKKDTRFRTICATWVSLFSFLILGGGLAMFALGLSDLIAQLKAANFIVELEPQMKMDYSFYVAIGGNLCVMVLIWMLYCLIREPKEDLETMSADAVKELKRRKAVVRRYFTDVDNTTHIYEANPVDNFSGRRFPGWTQEVDMGSPNVPHTENDSTDLALNPITSVMKDTTGLQRPVLHNQPLAKTNNQDLVPDICKTEQPVAHGFCVQRALEDGVNSPGVSPLGDLSPKKRRPLVALPPGAGGVKLPPLPGSTGGLPDILSPKEFARLGARPESRRSRRVTRAPKPPNLNETGNEKQEYVIGGPAMVS